MTPNNLRENSFYTSGRPRCDAV